jgi:D-sedoheptulose 7-phosphate isomerase
LTPGGGVEKIRESLNGLAALAGRVAKEQAEEIAAIADRYETTLRGGGTLFFAGNGGSAADAQHLATEYVVRYQTNRPAMRAIALTTDTSLLTACANDMGFDEVFARQVEALAEPGDLLVLHSTSGESPNVIRAAQSAKARGVSVVALLGKKGGRLKELADVVLVIPADDTAHIQELHLAIEHVICDLVENRLKG